MNGAATWVLLPVLSGIYGCAPMSTEDITLGASSAESAQREGDSLATASDAYCPRSFWFDNDYRLCVNDEQALGPFPPAMVDLCKANRGGEECDGAYWQVDFARTIRGRSRCPPGSTLERGAACVARADAYGPFTKLQYNACRASLGGPACEKTRWAKALLVGRASAVAAQLDAYYASDSGYYSVTEDVLSWYGTRTNGCVAFMSTALRHVGIDVPYGSYAGVDISLVTSGLAGYLRDVLGWRRVDGVGDLLPGDVVFTQDEPSDPGYAAHAYMFHGWVDAAAGIGEVVDNQKAVHERNIFGYAGYNFTPFAFALRPE